MQHNPVKGVSLLSFALMMGVLMSALSKILTGNEGMNPIEVIFWQTTVALTAITLLIVLSGDLSRFKTKRLKGQLLRAVAGNLGFASMYAAYAVMPMADVATLLFTGGLLTTILSSVWLGEQVGPYRWGAVFFGFIGAAIAASPSGEGWQMDGVLYALFSALIGGAIINILLRTLASTEHAMTTSFYTLLCGLIMTAPYVVLYGSVPDMQSMVLIIGCGLSSVTILISKTQAFRHAEASLLSPVQYTMIIWAALLGWLIWEDIPSLNTIIGAAIIISANLIILWRENKKG